MFGNAVPDYMFYQNTNIQSVYLSYDIWQVNEFSFADSTLQTLDTEFDNINIRHDAFRNCNYLEAINRDNNVNYLSCKQIGGNAFNSCVRLDSINVGNKCQSVGVGAFTECIGLASFTGGDRLTNILDDAFSVASQQRTLTVTFSTENAPIVGRNGLGTPAMLTVRILNNTSAEAFTNNFDASSGWDQYTTANGTTYVIV